MSVSLKANMRFQINIRLLKNEIDDLLYFKASCEYFFMEMYFYDGFKAISWKNPIRWNITQTLFHINHCCKVVQTDKVHTVCVHYRKVHNKRLPHSVTF